MDRIEPTLNGKQLVVLRDLIEVEEKARFAFDNASHSRSTTVMFTPKNQELGAALAKTAMDAPCGVAAIFEAIFSGLGDM